MRTVIRIENRRSRRALVWLDVYCEGYSRRLRAQICDLSVHGSFIRTCDPLPVGSRLATRFAGRDKTRFITAHGEVRHARSARGMGIEFRNVNDELTKEIEKILKKYVLLVDDDETNRKSLRRFFETRGNRVCEAADGRQAQAAATKEAFDLVITDSLVPHFEEFDLHRQVRTDHSCRQTKVLVMTSVDRAGLYDLGAVARLRADAYLRKPFTMDRFEKAIHALGA